MNTAIKRQSFPNATVLLCGPGLSILLTLLLLGADLHSAEPSRVWKLWEGKTPGDFTVPGPESVTKRGILRITNIAEPRLEFYEPAAEKKNGAAVVIVPAVLSTRSALPAP